MRTVKGLNSLMIRGPDLDRLRYLLGLTRSEVSADAVVERVETLRRDLAEAAEKELHSAAAGLLVPAKKGVG